MTITANGTNCEAQNITVVPPATSRSICKCAMAFYFSETWLMCQQPNAKSTQPFHNGDAYIWGTINSVHIVLLDQLILHTVAMALSLHSRFIMGK